MLLRQKLFKIIFIIGTFLTPWVWGTSESSNWLYGFSLGFGATGIQTASINENQLIPVQRSEGPGVINIFAEYIFSDQFSFGIEHVRGFRFGPFSYGLSFTGVNAKWYYWNPLPSYTSRDETKSRLFLRQLSPFAGIMTGIAGGGIHRSYDLVGDVSGSGLYLGIQGGIDFLLRPGLGIRTSVSYASTLAYSEYPVTTLSEFAAQTGIFFFY